MRPFGYRHCAITSLLSVCLPQGRSISIAPTVVCFPVHSSVPAIRHQLRCRGTCFMLTLLLAVYCIPPLCSAFSCLYSIGHVCRPRVSPNFHLLTSSSAQNAFVNTSMKWKSDSRIASKMENTCLSRNINVCFIPILSSYYSQTRIRMICHKIWIWTVFEHYIITSR